jgi:hypothetical protein
MGLPYFARGAGSGSERTGQMGAIRISSDVASIEWLRAAEATAARVGHPALRFRWRVGAPRKPERQPLPVRQ